MYKSNYMNAENGPRELQRKVQFDLRYYFARWSIENIYTMTKSTFKLEEDRDTQISYITELRMKKQRTIKKLIVTLSLDLCQRCQEANIAPFSHIWHICMLLTRMSTICGNILNSQIFQLMGKEYGMNHNMLDIIH